MTGWVAETLVATTLLLALVLALRVPVRRLFGAGAAYALWLVPALRLVLPPFDFVPNVAAPIAGQPVEIVMAASPGTPAGAAWLLTLWAAGALLFAGWHVLSYRRFIARALADAERLAGPGNVLATSVVQGPAAIGLLTPRILVPRDFESRFDARERGLAIRHEHVHHSRGDLWANAAALGMLALHWFNPLAHWAYRAFREDQELSCDAAVIAASDDGERAAYGAALVKAAHGAWGARAAPLTTCPMTRTRNLKRRLKMVKTHKKSALASLGGAFALGITGLAGLTLTATGAIAQDPVVKTERITIKRVAGQDGAEAAIAEVTKGKCGTNNPTVFKLGDGDSGEGKTGATRFIMCNADGKPIDRLSALQSARARIAGSADVDAANRAKVLQALDSAIAQTKAGN